MTVEIVRWPEDAGRLEELRRVDVPRLLVVAAGHSPPEIVGCLEDWVAAERQDDERAVRAGALEARAARHHPRPVIDRSGVLRYREGLLPLSAVEQAMMRELIDRFEDVVERGTLLAAGWPAASASQNLLDVHILRLRRRLRPLGLEIRTVRARGYALVAAAPAGGERR